MITDSPVNNHKDLLNVVDGLLGGGGPRSRGGSLCNRTHASSVLASAGSSE
jgi:hypothetical protein